MSSRKKKKIDEMENKSDEQENNSSEKETVVFKRKPGCPPKKHTGRKATIVRVEAMKKAEEEAKKSHLNSVVGGSVFERAAMAEGLRTGFQELFRLRQPHEEAYLPAFLDSLKNKNSWTQIATVRTLDVTFWFNIQENDYNIHDVKISTPVDITWIGHAFIAPKAAHVRRFLVGWKDPLPIALTLKELAIMKRKTVTRWNYICNGTCSITPHSKQWKVPASGETSDSDSESTAISSDQEYSEKDGSYTSSESEKEKEAARVQSRGHRCSGNVKLRLEVLADNLNVVYIWQQNEHPHASTEQLNWSRGLHNDVGHALHLFGVKPFMVMKNLIKSYGFPEDIAGIYPPESSVMFPNVFPPWRLPSYRQVSNMMPAIKRRAQLDWDPFQAVSLMYKRHHEQMYFYVPHDENFPDEESEFSCAISTVFSLEALILHGSQDGVGLDMSWRNKNEHRAAVSFLIAVDRQGHLTPGAVLISANVKAETIKKFLNETEERVVRRARAIVAGGLDCIVHPDSQDRKDIFSVSETIVKENQWFIKKWMIDKSASLLSGIRKHDPNAMILVCQFHIVQAIIRLDGGQGRILNAPRLPYTMKYEIVKAFRQVQRCRSMNDWITYHQNFVQALREIIMKSPAAGDPLIRDEETFSDDEHPVSRSRSTQTLSKRQKEPDLSESQRESIFDFMSKFFDDNWFTPHWLEHVTDMGLSDGETRDGTFYTNNWCESSFQTFDKVFLGLTKNKRLDCLVAIIIGDFFPFYETIGPRNPRIPWETLNTNFEAYKLWDTKQIQDLGGRMYSVVMLTKLGVQSYTVNLSVPQCECKCPDWNQSGKACIHMRAARLLEANGPVSEWEVIEVENQRRLATSLSRSKQAIKLRRKRVIRSEQEVTTQEPLNEDIKFPMDPPLEKELDRLIENLGKDPAYVTRPERARTHSPPLIIEERSQRWVKIPRLREPDGFRSGWLASPGRPGRIPPMAPWRNKGVARKHIRFSLKPGKKPATRLHPNSLFTTEMMGRNHSAKFKRSVARHSPSKVNHLSTGPLANPSGLALEDSKVTVVQQSDQMVLAVNPNETVSGLTAEDGGIASVDMTRWNDGGYTLRVDEMDVLVEILNGFSVSLMDGRRWYTISGSGFEKSVLGALTSEKPTEFETRIRDKLTRQRIDTFVFLEITASTEHWTCWEYSISSTGHVICTGFNSLLPNAFLEAVDRNIQLSIMNAYVKLKYAHLPLQPVSPHFHSVNTGLQTDTSSCGFWAVFLAFLPLINVQVDLPSLRSIPTPRLKFWLGRFWTRYFRDTHGVRGKDINDIHAALIPHSTGLGLPEPQDVIARRPRDRAQIYVFSDLMSLKPGDEPRYFARMIKPKYKIVIGHETLDSTDFGRLLGHTESGWLSEAILNAYFDVFLKDLAFERGVMGLQPLWYIASTTVTICMATQSPREPFHPRDVLRTKPLWFPACNIFEIDNLILPWHVNRGKLQHWMIIHIQPPFRRVQIYDSLGYSIERYHILACQRTLGPKQTDSTSCGLFVIINAEALCTGNVLDNSEIYSSTKIEALRRKLALRLSREEILLSKDLSSSPEPTPKPGATASRSESLEPLSPTLKKVSSEPESGSIDALMHLVMTWALWFRPEDKMYWAGRITEVDAKSQMCLVVIPFEIIPGAEKNYILIKSVFDIIHEIVQSSSITPEQIAPIWWPAYLTGESVHNIIRDYGNSNDRIDWDVVIQPVKRPLVEYLRSHLTEVAAALFDEETALLPDLRTEATTILKRGRSSVEQSHDYIESHLRLLDAYDKEIIMHLATWHIREHPTSSASVTGLSWKLGLGAPILAYMAMGWYLNVPEQQAYDLYIQARLILPQSLAEQAWEPMSQVFNKKRPRPSYQEFFKEVTSTSVHKHRIVDFSLHLPHVTVSPEYLASQPALIKSSTEEPCPSGVTLEDAKQLIPVGTPIPPDDAFPLEAPTLNDEENLETSKISPLPNTAETL